MYLGLDNSGIRFSGGKKKLSSPKRPSRLSVQPASCSVSSGAKQQEPQAENSSSSNSELKSGWSYTSTPPTCFQYLWSSSANFASNIEDQNICWPPKLILQEPSVCRLAVSSQQSADEWRMSHEHIITWQSEYVIRSWSCMDRISVMCITADGSWSRFGAEHKLMPAEGTDWLQGLWSRWPDA